MNLPLVLGRHLEGVTDRPDFDLATWPDIDVGALPPGAAQSYLQRKEGVRLYLEGASAEVVRAACNLGLRQVNRLIRERCVEPHPDGRIYGWRGLVKYMRIAPYTRRAAVCLDNYGFGAAGAMQSLLQGAPDFARRLEAQILKACPPDRLGEVRRPVHSIWNWFLSELRKLGYEIRNEWPFTAKTLGYSSLRRHIGAVLDANPRRAALVSKGPDLVTKLKTGDGVDRPVNRPFQRVEMDAHKLNGRFCILMPQVHGGWLPRMVHRIWVIVLLEVVTRAVIGYYISLRREVNMDDVLRAIKFALSRWEPKQQTLKEMKYGDGAALPSGHDERYLGLCWDELSVDGALAQTCKTVAERLKFVVGSSLASPSDGFSSRRSKDDRPFIETYFRTLGRRGLGRLSNSTGSKPSDKHGRDPDKVALASQFTIEYAQELLDVLIANYNATPHAGLGYRSPLSLLDFLVRRDEGLILRKADPHLVSGLLSLRKKCIVKGGFQEGRRPYVNFYGCRYTNDILGDRHDLVGKHIFVTNHLDDDARVALASTLDGYSLGVVRAAPPWHGLPYSLAVRSAIQALERDRKLYIASGGDAIATFINAVESSPKRQLPIHPAYLEVMRILAAHARTDPGQDLEMGRRRISERQDAEIAIKKFKEQQDEGAGDLDQMVGTLQRSEVDVASSPRRGAQKRKLPTQRMAASN